MKLRLVITALAVFGLAGTASAFHGGGVANCESCHTMHNSLLGVAMTNTTNANKTVGSSNPYLLKGADQSSTCLNCHGGTTAGKSYRVATTGTIAAGTAPVNYTPGGDFGWVSKSFTWGTSSSSAGKRHGHNIVAADFGFVADDSYTGTMATGNTANAAPGGTYPVTSLSCISCHDPHGKYRFTSADPANAVNTGAPIYESGSYGAAPTAGEAIGAYRLLAGTGYIPKSQLAVSGVAAFANNSPIAVAPSTYNRQETTTDTRVAYGSGMSEWCSNCHTAMHNETTANLRHLAGNGADMTNVFGLYNTYVKSGDVTGTFPRGGPYNSLVPFEEGTTDRTVLASHAVMDGTQMGGATATSNVMCLSCHRAHASGWNSMMRWNQALEFLTIGGEYPATDATGADAIADAQGRTTAEVTAAYYGRAASEFATYQRSLCNKCHAKD